jgi:hypothetical protein
MDKLLDFPERNVSKLQYLSKNFLVGLPRLMVRDSLILF